jgi:hypothetical protein
MIPYLGPEFVEAILEEMATSRDLRTASTVEDSVAVHCSQSASVEKQTCATSQWNVSRSQYSRLFAVVAKLIVLWLV